MRIKELYLGLWIGITLGLSKANLTFAQQKSYTLSGFVTDGANARPLSGVRVSVRNQHTHTRPDGYYRLEVSADTALPVAYSLSGYQNREIVLRMMADRQQPITLNVQTKELKEVVVKSASVRASESVQMSGLSVPIEQVKAMPTLLGEKDVIKALQLLPGVQKGSEGSTGLYVRGGGPDQNLVLLDDIPVYHTSHLFGFFSLFNGDAIESVDLTKGGFPARFGGRLSSVIELKTRDGDREKLHGEGGIGLISSRMTLEGPITKGKSSFLISARRTYADLLLNLIQTGASDQNGYFYDLNLKTTFDVSPSNTISLTAYTGEDRFIYNTKGTITRENGKANWRNAAAALRWNHRFSNRWQATTALLYTHYNSTVNLVRNVVRDTERASYRLQNKSYIEDVSLKTDFDWLLGEKHTLRTGLILTAHHFRPSTYTSVDEAVQGPESVLMNRDTWEAAAYLEDTYVPFPALKINAGIRYSGFRTGTKDYLQPEPRLALAYSLPRNWAVKASAASMSQYVHLLANSGFGLPTDLWIPSTQRTKPQLSKQAAFGVAKDFRSGVTFTAEGFYKTMDRMVSYKEGSTSLAYTISGGGSWEDQITQGRGWSYGAELLLQKKTGRFTGWAGYTLSWTKQQFDKLNFGRWFYARYDRRHDLSLVGIYHLNANVTLSSTWVYGTSPALTMPQGQYWISNNSGLDLLGSDKAYYTGRVFEEYGRRNGFRAAPYQHLDVAVQFHKKKRRFERTWEISVYNLYNQQNPFIYYFDTVEVSTDPKVKKYENRLKQVTLFPIMPSVSYGFKF